MVKWIIEQPMIWVWEIEAKDKIEAILKAEELSESDSTGQRYLPKIIKKKIGKIKLWILASAHPVRILSKSSKSRLRPIHGSVGNMDST